MELREWLIILGLALVTLIVIDGVRRLQRQRRVPRLDQPGDETPAAQGVEQDDPEAAAREAEINWELPNGGARVVRPAEEQGVKAKPKLQRQEHPGPSRVLSEFRRQKSEPEPTAARRAEPATHGEPTVAAAAVETERREPVLDDGDGRGATGEPLAADPADHDGYDDEDYRLVDLEGMGDSLKNGSRRVGSSVQRFGASLQKGIAERRDQKKARREQEKAERAEQAEKAEQARREQAARQQQEADEAARRQRDSEAREAEHRQAAAEQDDPLFAPRREAPREASEAFAEEAPRDDVVRSHPVLEKALRHDVEAEHARDALGEAEELIVISVMARGEEGFSGSTLLELMMACGLRYGRDMGIFHRFETEDPGSALQFSMVNVVKPGTFPLEAMDEFSTPGVTLLMPLPGASDTSAAFEAMVETAMVIVRHLGGELKDEQMSVMTAQTVEFARQRVQEFERRHRLHRQVN
ncbi:cell division protein ZipA [Halomonas borealis]|uniref:cell division protein ZipA n=1 Tax=Halomonas borealis TaxID=2508710 RepID=UPI00109F7C8D|nr:cell division protein ZipA [Halomonas borealis]